MTRSTKRFLFWVPRGLAILFIVFLGLFAFDVFGEGYGFFQTLLALVMHLIPNLFLVLVLVLAWKWEWVGALVFSGLGVLYIVMAWGKVPSSAFLAISGPLFVMGALFLAGWVKRDEIRA